MTTRLVYPCCQHEFCGCAPTGGCCGECPFVQCPKEAGLEVMAALHYQQVRALTRSGRTAGQIAVELGVSRRTVFRLLAEADRYAAAIGGGE